MWEVVSSQLVFHFMVDGKDQYYFVPQGTEDVLFGSGVILSATITWNAGTAKLYLNDSLANSSSFSVHNPSWSSTSNFDFGAYEYLTYGGFNVSDDVIADFVVEGP